MKYSSCLVILLAIQSKLALTDFGQTGDVIMIQSFISETVRPFVARSILGRGIFVLTFVLCCGASQVVADTSKVGEWDGDAAAALIAAAAEAEKPALTGVVPAGMKLDEVYKLQTAAVRIRLADKPPFGFKAGLTSVAAQKKFAVKQAVAGVLLNPGNYVLGPDYGLSPNDDAAQARHYRVRQADFNRMMLEVELGFRLKRQVAEPVADIAELKELVASIVPVIELPDLAFDDMSAITGIAIIANNVLAHSVLVGAERAVANIDVNALSVAVNKDGEQLLLGYGSDAMGDQWQALLWLVNRQLANGWQIMPEQLLITGALGRMLPAGKGRYAIDFGVLGMMEMSVD